MELVSIAEIRAAAENIGPVAVRTPVLPCLWADPDRPLWLKPENLQPIGSFKIRGAYTALSRLSEADRACGVVAYSSGNHAQAVAYAARAFGVPAVIVIEATAPAIKVEATRALGAEVVQVPLPERETAAAEIGRERGMTLIPPFDHPDVIAGQGTIGLEIVTDLPDVDLVLVPISGGGLASGIAAAVKALRPSAAVFGVEPEIAADTAAGFAAGERVHLPPEQRARTMADGLRAEPSELTFAHLRKLIDGVVTVTEDEILAAVGTLARRSHLVAEPSGAVTTAAYLNRAADLPAGRTVAVVSGGNIDPALFAKALQD
ncbi:threonine/serine dehydratase [Actinophytocola sp.]|uniref:threonine ammonia-lyase n=1 Tax=Actinophytocola sp. TaxID=1872138 RepID=UPI002D7F8ACC|nr:threonine/serine dehydratase [Actinophytocola sp.]HET9139901.1 threonine/serine dehydratase [Actinophytocola sp.]